VLGINSDPATIKQVEVEIIHRAFASGWVVPLRSLAAGAR
jgi:glutamate synthase (NADPH) small chain